MSNHIEDKKADKVSNFIDLTLVIVASVAYLMHIEYPSLSKFITNGVGFIFIVLVIPHFIMMFNEKKILNYHFLKYIIETSYNPASFIIRNSVIYFVYYYIWSFNQNDIYFTGLTMVVAFDVIVLVNILSVSRINVLKVRFEQMTKPKSTDPD
jgi:phage terminase large subunit-like protein